MDLNADIILKYEVNYASLKNKSNEAWAWVISGKRKPAGLGNST